MKRNLPLHIIRKKQEQEPIVMLTAYDAMMAKAVEAAGADMILVGDSLGNVIAGYDNTIPVTMDQMVMHTQYVSRVSTSALIVADMPFMSYHESREIALRNAGRLIKEGGAQAVKIEVGPSDVGTVKAIVESGIPVMSHLGFTPQSMYQQGGYRVQGRSEEDSKKMTQLAKELETVGCFSVLLEMVPAKLAAAITADLSIPVIGIGGGRGCDGQVLVTYDVLGMLDGKVASFVKQYAQVSQAISSGLDAFVNDVKTRNFPGQEHEFE
jgi:3-methyl-2-oxobutanoate hydroxymethyltransferase